MIQKIYSPFQKKYQTPSKHDEVEKDQTEKQQQYFEKFIFVTPDKQKKPNSNENNLIVFKFESPSFFINTNPNYVYTYAQSDSKFISPDNFDMQDSDEDQLSYQYQYQVEQQQYYEEEDSGIVLFTRFQEKANFIIETIQDLLKDITKIKNKGQILNSNQQIPFFDLTDEIFSPPGWTSYNPCFFLSQDDENHLVFDVSQQLKKSRKQPPGEELIYQLEDNKLKRIYNCSFCHVIFEKACSLGGHISRVHQDQVKQTQILKLCKKPIRKFRNRK